MDSVSTLSSERLIKACVGSNSDGAWAEFIRRFRPLIARVSGRIARRHWPQMPPHLLDDLIQETYLKLCADDCKLLRQFQSSGPDSIFKLLKVVAARVVLDHFKAELADKRDASQTDALSDQSFVGQPLHGCGRCLSMEDLIALRQIDDIVRTHYKGETLIRNRAIFWLHHRDGMTAEAIASIPWINLNTKGVETALRRMKHLIQSHI